MTTLADLQLTYDAVGVTLDDARWGLDPLTGFHAVERRSRVGSGTDGWEQATDALMRWAVKTRSGFAVDGTARPGHVEVGGRHRIRAHVGPFRVTEPVEVVALVDEPDRRGFAYGTLAGHPLSGEEAFLLERGPDGSVELTIRSLSRPAPGVRRAWWPVTVLARPIYVRRYERALRDHP